jgi:hypothetical protein
MGWYEEIRERYEAWERSAFEEGWKEGREEALREVLVVWLTQRFGSVPESALARIREADTDTLKQWARRVIPAASLDDVLA